MIGKQTKGRGFRGALNYVLGKEGAEIIGGNMLGESARELSAEFGEARKLKPNLSRVVYHASLSLPPGEGLSDSKWAEVADRYIEGMGFKGAQYVAVKHTDTNHSHIHIVASRIKMDGKVVSESHDYKRSETHIRGLEQEFGLTPTTPSRETGIRAPTSGELHKALREKQPSTKLRLQNLINSAVPQCSTMSELMSHLEAKGIAVVPNVAKTGHVTGISFKIDGEMMKGSDLGRSFTWQGLQKRGVNYEPRRDLQTIRQAADHRVGLNGLQTDGRGDASGQHRDRTQVVRRADTFGKEHAELDRGGVQKHFTNIRHSGVDGGNSTQNAVANAGNHRSGDHRVNSFGQGDHEKSKRFRGSKGNERSISMAEDHYRDHGHGHDSDAFVHALLKLIFGKEEHVEHKNIEPEKRAPKPPAKEITKSKSKSRGISFSR